MRTFDKLIENKLISTNPQTLKSIIDGEIEIGVPIPSDYCYLLLNSDGYKNNGGWHISIDGNSPIVEIDDLVSLEWLVKERGYDLNDEDAEIYRSKFLKIASCLNQDRILMGFAEDVLNQIYWYDFDDERLVKISDSIFDFISINLIKYEESQ